MKHATRRLVVVAFTTAALVISPSAAGAEDRILSPEKRPCVSKVEWNRLDALTKPTLESVEQAWEVQGLGFDAVLVFSDFGIEWPTRAYPRCKYPNTEIAWYGLIADETGVVVMKTGFCLYDRCHRRP